MVYTALERFRDIVTASDENINLAEAALLIAANEYSGLDIKYYLEQLDSMAQEIRRRISRHRSVEYTLDTMNEYLFDELGFSGNLTDFNDPKNSFINDVLDRRLGIPISLSLIYMEVGRRLGLVIDGVSFPGHFIVKLQVAGEALVLDPFANGIALDQEELELRLKHFSGEKRAQWDLQQLLVPATNKEILARMLRNLKAIYIDEENFEKALSVISFILLVEPQSVVDIRERAYIYDRLDCFQAAIDDYRNYLMMVPNAKDMALVQARLMDLSQSVRQLH